MAVKYGVKITVSKKHQILQNKALRAISFKPSRAAPSPLFKNCKVLKLADLQLKNNLPPSLSGGLSLVDTQEMKPFINWIDPQIELYCMVPKVLSLGL